MEATQLLSRAWILALFFFAGSSHALVINLDLGPAGGTFSGTTVDMPGPNAENVTILFQEGLYLQVGPQNMGFGLRDWGVAPTGGNFVSDLEFGFLDENGDVLLSEFLSQELIATESLGRVLSVPESFAVFGLFFNVDPVGPLDPAARVEFILNGSIMAAATDVPEPATLTLLGLGLVGMYLGARKRRQRA